MSTGSRRTALTIAGLSGLFFWFILGFPFAHQNESYVWAAQLDTLSLWKVATRTIHPVANYRPLGTALAWITFHLAGKATWLQQLTNLAFVVAAWVVVLRAARCLAAAALAALIVTGACFSGYIFLFHLHGVFYGPLMLLLAWYLSIALRSLPPTTGRVWAAAGGALATYFFHPFAALFYIAFVAGWVLEHVRRGTRPGWWAVAATLAAAVAVMILVDTGEVVIDASRMLAGLVTSFRVVEVNPAVSAAAAVLALGAVLVLPPSRAWRLPAAIAVLVACALAVALSVPVLFVAIASCAAAAALRERWTLVALAGCTFILPVAAATGSPTYTVFVLMASAAVVGLAEAPCPLDTSRRAPGVAIAFAAVVLGLAAPLRAGVQLPVLDRLVAPVVGEREKTQQMQAIIEWYLHGDRTRYDLRFLHSAKSPVRAHDIVDRRHRPTTAWYFLKRYLAYRRDAVGISPPVADSTFVVTFGGQRVEGAEPVHRVPSRAAGPALVYLLPDSEAPLRR